MIILLFVVNIDEIENQPQSATPNEIPFHVALIWDSPRIKWLIGAVFAEDACWIVAGVFFDMNW